MPDLLTGVAARRDVYVESEGAAVTGLTTLTYALVGPTGSTLVAALPATEAGGGVYSYLLDGTTHLAEPGLYTETWLDTTSGTDLRVDSLFTVGAPSTPLLTLAQVRARVARLCLRDHWPGVATGGSASTLVDTSRIEPDDDWRGAWLWISGGTGRMLLPAHERRISTNVQVSGALSPGSNFAVTPGAGAVYELHRRFSTWEYNDAINSAITTAGRTARIPVVTETLAQAAAETDVQYPVPAGLVSVSGLYVRDEGSPSNPWIPLNEARGDYAWLPARRLLTVRSVDAGSRFRVVGEMRADELRADGSFLDVEPDFVVYEAAASLLSTIHSGPQTDRDAAFQLSNEYQKRADQRRPAQFARLNVRRVRA